MLARNAIKCNGHVSSTPSSACIHYWMFITAFHHRKAHSLTHSLTLLTLRINLFAFFRNKNFPPFPPYHTTTYTAPVLMVLSFLPLKSILYNLFLKRAYLPEMLPSSVLSNSLWVTQPSQLHLIQSLQQRHHPLPPVMKCLLQRRVEANLENESSLTDFCPYRTDKSWRWIGIDRYMTFPSCWFTCILVFITSIGVFPKTEAAPAKAPKAPTTNFGTGAFGSPPRYQSFKVSIT